MPYDRQTTISKLRGELAFIEAGGYRKPARMAWRQPALFEDSPTCLNYDSTHPRRPCCECVLMEFVPEDSRKNRTPCRFVALNERGETVDSFYRTGTQEELETAVINWLKATIARLQGASAQTRQKEETPQARVQAKFVSAE